MVEKGIHLVGGIPLGLPEVKVHDKKTLQQIADALGKPVLRIIDAQGFQEKGGARIPITKTHSCDCFISDGVLYKHIYDVKEEE